MRQKAPEAMVMRAATHCGRRRPNNEDVALARELANGHVLLAVADGVGGQRGGEVASAEAAAALVEHLESRAIDDPAGALREAFLAANARVRERAQTKPELAAMSTTLVAALVLGETAWLANVGDSRAYLIERGEARQLTQDHSWAEERRRMGLLTQEEIASGYGRNIIARSVGHEAKVEVDTFGPLALPDGATLLLSSDGLHDVLSDAEIARGVTESGAESCERLIDAANERGGPDNIAVALLRH